MTPLLSEKFLMTLFLWLFAFLGGMSFIVALYVLRFRRKPEEYPVIRMRRVKSRQPVRSAGRSGEDAFREKLGDRVVGWMIELSRSQDAALVRDRIRKILAECERLNAMRIPEENKKILSTVLIWARKFDAERHVSELKIYRKSTQILYDGKRRDFKLRVEVEAGTTQALARLG